MSDIKILYDAIVYYTTNYKNIIPIRNVSGILELVRNTPSIPDLFISRSWFFNTNKPEILKYVSISKLIEIMDCYAEYKKNDLEIVSTSNILHCVLTSL